ncbi:glyoxylase-like metal-dependent hydrolase (beta-lactamase superfamily II) [Anoxybacillus voinovskiensis]|uniref:Glyoxylase-like metal-dependent hydrolase (Beta-lactamase superfamily II) n=1 Tax=Anoxybacteroides voinovskiense TaxID=230470 RepID=A0A840DWI0_9BACL|nr:MBL fold metallo-hydrolase [Anoxybacillus voinovskiensis]MBB4073869.1 glyoxylase-like metal-dependent hydrolase (beta-lactamase superfamily II) [Anoxybacillus voinovskiensis]GGJ66525.1 MBL fold metallo-hydrolase [Anoxybacillus voinovskiensis]
MRKPVDLGHDISLIDVFDLKTPNRTGTYVLHEKELTIIETSASPSIPYLLNGLESLGITLADIQYMIVTHIHLDHAGGAGLLLEKCPNARVIVHPKGKRHLADPSKLIQGAKAVYGEKFAELFEPIVPIPEDRLVTMEDGDTLALSNERTLTFFDTPGHANHHFSIYDSKSNGIFTGDTIGVYYPQLLAYGVELYLPSTSPSQFNQEAMLHSAKRLEELNPSRIYFGHFGMSEHPATVFQQLREWLPKMVEVGERVMKEQPFLSFEDKTKAVADGFMKLVQPYLEARGVPREESVYELLRLDLSVCAMGMVDYFQKQEEK